MSDKSRLSFIRCILSEMRIAGAIASVITPLVFVSNDTASAGMILLHAVLLLLLVPLVICCVSRLSNLIFRANSTKPNLYLDLVVHEVGVVGGALLMIPLLALITGIPSEVLAAKPLIAGIIPVCLAYGIWILTRYYREAKIHALTLEAENARRAWQALSAQIKPHFLFNTLSCLEQLIDVNPATAKQGIARLADLYRSVLDASERRFVSAAEALSQAEDYLQLQQMRFGERLRINIDLHAEVEHCRVPSTLLLTLVENAVKHGIEPSLKGGTVVVRIRGENNRLRIVVENPVPRHAAAYGNGHGLKDVKERLQLLFGNAADFSIVEADGTVTASAELPRLTTDVEGGR